ncbi:LysR family transcriptional regulator [Photobacterium minamisatsumaniensis]|uniref:LysR family transcriptional regulator n=1 Tax=Photobacterium minamisatsumaniensis TaxID=2910233 RepID=UPI003D0DBC91
MMKSSTLAGLATFEVVARFGSLTQAAKQLHLTTGALSQQIKQLEQRLQLSLFERHSRGLTLTDNGTALYQVVSQSIEDIEAVLVSLQQPADNKEVRLKLTPSFAYKWLVPKLHDFYRQYPDIKVLTFADGALVDHHDASFDLVIDYCRHSQAGNTQLLIEETLLPVMSPSYLPTLDWHNVDDWQQVTLLHDALPWREADKNSEWQYWFSAMADALKGQITVDTLQQQGHYFNRTDMAMAAAEAGLGVAMARSALIQEDIRNGRLISPFSPISANAGYYLFQKRSTPSIDCFCRWLTKQSS